MLLRYGTGAAAAALFLGVVLISMAGCAEGDTDGVRADDPYEYGQRIYTLRCQTCHQADGSGIRNAFPPLKPNPWVEGDTGRLIRLVLHGVRGEMEVRGATYQGVMPGFGYLNDDEVAGVLTYVRQSFGNDTTAVSPEQVAAIRAAEDAPRGGWDADALWNATGIPDIENPAEAEEAPAE